MNEIKKKLVALEAKVDATLFAVTGYTGSVRGQRRSIVRGEDGKWYREDGTEAKSVGDFKTVGGAAATAGAVGSGLVADRAIMNRYGGGGSGMAVRKSAYRSAGRDLMESGRAMGGRAIDAGNDGFRAGQRSWRATKPGAIGNRTGKTGLFGRMRKALGKGLAVATGGKVRFEDQVKARIEFMIPAVIPMMARRAAGRIGNAVTGWKVKPSHMRDLRNEMRSAPADVSRMAKNTIPALTGAVGALSGGMRGVAAGAAVGGATGAVKGAMDENTSVLGGAFKGALGGGALGGVAGAGIGGASGVSFGNRLMRTRSLRGFSEIKKRLVELAEYPSK